MIKWSLRIPEIGLIIAVDSEKWDSYFYWRGDRKTL